MIILVALMLVVLCSVVCVFVGDIYPAIIWAASLVGGIFAGVWLVVCIIMCFDAHLSYSAHLAKLEQRRAILVYQLENDLYDNDNDYGKMELYDSIQSWNEDLAVGKTYNSSIWFDALVNDAYDMVDFIQYDLAE